MNWHAARTIAFARAAAKTRLFRHVARAISTRCQNLPLVASRRGRASAADDGPAPILSEEEKRSLLHLARTVVTHHLGGERNGTMPVSAPRLLHRTEPVFVTFWVDGKMRGCRGEGGGSLFHNTVLAAQRTLRDQRVVPLGANEVSRLRIELDVLGPTSRVRARRLKRFVEVIEPGIHGVMVEKEGRRALFKSATAITKNWKVGELIPQLCEKGGWPRKAYRRPGIRFSRFCSTSFIEGEGGLAVCDLLRANRLVSARDWSPDRIAEAIREGAEFLVRAQRADGGFAYQYAPAEGRYAPEDNVVRQVATTWLMVKLAHRFGDARYWAAARRSLAFVQGKARPGPAGANSALVDGDGGEVTLGATAFGLLTVASAEDDGLLALGQRLAEAILRLQQPNGRFLAYFPPSTRADGQDFYPGEAMLALMTFHARHPDPRYPEALRRAFAHYRDYFRRERPSAFPPWQMAAYAQLYRLTRERDYAEFVFEMADWMLPRQYTGVNAPYPDYVGGYAGGRVPGIPSATYNEGVLEAYDLACQLAERERAALYQRAALTAVLFTLRLQFTKDNSFYVEHAERVWGGFRASLADSTMRIDHTQHAVNSLLKAERYFGTSRATTKGGDRVRDLLSITRGANL